MELNLLQRQTIGNPAVLIENPDKSLSVAGEMLTADVCGDLQETRNTIVEAFGVTTLPNVGSEMSSEIASFFMERGWSIPQSVLIDPKKDTFTLRAIMQNAKFPFPTDDEFFTGANGAVVSPGGSPQRDLVFFHDWRGKYEDSIVSYVTSQGYTISDESLAEAVDLKLADFMVHEIAHLAGRLAIQEVVVKLVDGVYRIEDRSTAGFISVHDNIAPPELDEDSNHYCGPAIDEGWAAFNSSEFILRHLGYKRKELPVSYRYMIPADVMNSEGVTGYTPVSGLASNDAGIVLERLDKKYGAIFSSMIAAANGQASIPDAISSIRSRMPKKIHRLLDQPNYQAWQKLKKITKE